MSFISKIKISTRLWLSLGVSLVLLAALAASGLRSLAASNAAIEDMYGAGLQHTARVGQILDKLGESRAHVLLAMQHDPSGQYAALHDHAISQHLDSIRENSALIDSLWAEIQASDLNDSELATVREFTDVRDTLLKKGMDPALAALERGDYKTVAEILVTVINPTFEKVDGVAETFLGQQSDEAAANHEEANTRYRTGVILSIGLLGIAVLVVGGLSWLTARSVGRSVHALDDAATRLGEGDLTVRVAAVGRDELAHIGEAFNRVAERFGEIVRQLQEASSQIAASADQTSVVTKQSTEGMRRQQAETEQVATAMNQMNATVHDVAHSAAEAASAAREADVSTNEGKNVVDQTMATIDRLAKEVEQASEVIRNLEQETASIGTVLDVIRGVAEQTNLLALNAAIEAARAGEQGRGFAVVADEVRTLASRTQKSTEEINDMIARLQSGAAQAVQVMEVGRNQANKGVEEAKLAGQALEVITAAMGRITDMNTQIANAAEEQGAVAEEINRNIANISQVTEETVGGAVQTGAASAQLASLAEQLHGMIARLRVS